MWSCVTVYTHTLLIVAIFPLQFTAPTLVLLLCIGITIVIVGWVKMGGGGISWGWCSRARAVQRVVGVAIVLNVPEGPYSRPSR